MQLALDAAVPVMAIKRGYTHALEWGLADNCAHLSNTNYSERRAFIGLRLDR